MLKTWQGKPENIGKAQEALLKRAKANSDAQLGKYDPSSEGSTEAAKSLYEKVRRPLDSCCTGAGT